LGEGVAVFGYPLSGLLSSGGNFTLGNVTALAGLRDDTRILQISAPVQPGNSGGPLLDDSGAVVGIIVAKLNAMMLAIATDDLAQNVNFAIKANVAESFSDAQGIPVQVSTPGGLPLPPADLADKAKAITVRVKCMR
jgi:serine protease Do